MRVCSLPWARQMTSVRVRTHPNGDVAPVTALTLPAGLSGNADSSPGSAEAKRLFLRLVRPRPEGNPYPLYARLRELGPVVPVHFTGAAPRYLITTFAECSSMLRDDAVRPLSEEHFDETYPAWRRQVFAHSLLRSMAFRSGADHRFDRAMLAKHFSPRRTAARREEIAKLIPLLLDQLERGATSGEPVDVERELAVPYSALVIGRLMGIPDVQAMRIGWATRQSGPTLELAPSPAQRQRAAEAGEQVWHEMSALAAERRLRPRDDLITDLVSQYGPDHERLISSLVLLFSAGFDSPASLIGLGLRLFLDNPEQARLLRENPQYADTAIEEILRCEPPVQVMFRVAIREITLAGVTIPPGSVLLGLVASASRDPALVADPDRFDVTRAPSGGLSFGGGAHYCLGAHLARLSGSLLFPRLLRRFPLMQPAGVGTYRAPGLALRGFERLPVSLLSSGGLRHDPRRPMNLLTVTEVAAMLRVSKMTIYRLVHAGRLPSFRVGQSYRIPAEAAAALFGVLMENQAG